MSAAHAPRQVARAFAPASIANLAVGFDILGHSFAGPGDIAEIRRIDAPEVRIDAIHGSVTELPLEPARNTAGAALEALRKALGLRYGFALELTKGIPLGSGMGGSAASCVAALIAANALLEQPLPQTALYEFAMAGEAVASGSPHGDNVGPMLTGGLALATREHLLCIAVPAAWHCALVHPQLVLETRRSRAVLEAPYPLHTFVAQSSHLALVLTGCHRGDAELVRAGLRDVLIEPRRAALIPQFSRVKQAALDHQALGAGIAGGGPSVFGWYTSRQAAEAAVLAMSSAFAEAGLSCDHYVSPIDAPAASLLNANCEGAA